MSRAPSIGDVMIAIRDIEAPWIEQRHITVLSMLAARLPTIRPTQSQMARSTRMHRGTVNETLAELRVRKLIAYDIGGKHGRACVYLMLSRNLRALIPRDDQPIAVGDTPYRRGREVPIAVGDTKSQGEEPRKQNPPTPRTVSRRAPPAPSSPDGGRGGEGIGPDPGVQRVLAAYAVVYRLARGCDAHINGTATRAAIALIDAVGIDGALLRIAHASSDPWWQSDGDLVTIATRPDRWATAPKPALAKTRLQPLAQRKGTA